MFRIARIGVICGLVWQAAAAYARDAAKPDAPAANQPVAKAVCKLAPGPTRTVTRVIDAETLALDDGREVRLVGALAPRAFDAGASPGQWPLEIDSVRVLSALTLGRRVRLAFGGRRADRYNRHLAHVFVVEDGRDVWVQGAMLEAGAARAYGLPENFACARELEAHEAEARRAKRGVWANYIYRAKPANRPAMLMRLRNRYVRVEGVVANVTTARGATFVNFGADWRSDFTARANRSTLKAHPGFQQSLEALKGQRVSVVGWIERGNGPMIELLDPSQIALIASDAPAAAAPPSDVAPSRTDGDDAGANENRPASRQERPGDVDL